MSTDIQTTQAQPEEWAPVKNWSRYDVSTHGRIRNVETGKLLRPCVRGGYLYVGLCCSGRIVGQLSVHFVVASTFHFQPRGCGDVNHKNGNKRRNWAENLEWLTRSENQRHAADIGLKPCGSESHLCTKLNAAKVLEIRAISDSGLSQSQIAQQFGVAQSHVWKIVHRKKWRQLK